MGHSVHTKAAFFCYSSAINTALNSKVAQEETDLLVDSELFNIRFDWDKGIYVDLKKIVDNNLLFLNIKLKNVDMHTIFQEETKQTYIVKAPISCLSYHSCFVRENLYLENDYFHYFTICNNSKNNLILSDYFMPNFPNQVLKKEIKKQDFINMIEGKNYYIFEAIQADRDVRTSKKIDFLEVIEKDFYKLDYLKEMFQNYLYQLSILEIDELIICIKRFLIRGYIQSRLAILHILQNMDYVEEYKRRVISFKLSYVKLAYTKDQEDVKFLLDKLNDLLLSEFRIRKMCVEKGVVNDEL